MQPGPIVPRVFVAAPDTSMILSGASTLLFTAVTVTCPLLSVSPASIVSVVPL